MIQGKSYHHPELLLESYQFFLIIKDKGYLSNILSEHIIYNLLDCDNYLIECIDYNQIKNNKIRRIKVTNIETNDIYYYIIDGRNHEKINIYNINASYKKVFFKNNKQNIEYNSLGEYLKNYTWEIVYTGDMKDILFKSN